MFKSLKFKNVGQQWKKDYVYRDKDRLMHRPVERLPRSPDQ